MAQHISRTGAGRHADRPSFRPQYRGPFAAQKVGTVILKDVLASEEPGGGADGAEECWLVFYGRDRTEGGVCIDI